MPKKKLPIPISRTFLRKCLKIGLNDYITIIIDIFPISLPLALADPLIKALTEIANKRPKDPVAYLTNYLQHFMGDRKPMTEVQVHSGSSKASTSSTSTLALAKSNASSNPRLASTRNGPGPTNADLIELDSRSLAEEEDAEGALAVQHMEERDEHGQSMLHFACARSHRRGALYTLIEESGIDITYRDELYRTARDVSLQANQPNNAAEIDRYVLAQAVIGRLTIECSSYRLFTILFPNKATWNPSNNLLCKATTTF